MFNIVFTNYMEDVLKNSYFLDPPPSSKGTCIKDPWTKTMVGGGGLNVGGWGG